MDDLSEFSCQNSKCPKYHQTNQGNLAVIGRYGKNRKIRLLYCRECKYRFSERKGTLFFKSRLDEAVSLRIMELIEKGYSVRRISMITCVNKDTVMRYLKIFNQRS